MTKYSWTQPSCEQCFRKRHPTKQPIPLLKHARAMETCVYCGLPTYDGIYDRVNPATSREALYRTREESN